MKLAGEFVQWLNQYSLVFPITFFRIWGTDGSDELGRHRNFLKCYENTKTSDDPSRIIELPNWDAVLDMFPVFASAPDHAQGKSSFKAIYNGNAGWVKPMDAMRLTKRECERLDVEFVSGLSGTAEGFLKGEDGRSINGVITKDGTVWHADKTILAARLQRTTRGGERYDNTLICEC